MAKKKTEETAPEEPTTTYVVLNPIYHDNEIYKREAQIDLTADEAEFLMAVKAVAPLAEKNEESK